MWPTYQTERDEAHARAGFDEVRSRLTIAEHCQGCVDEADRGWVPISTIVPIGQRTCKMNDRCFLEFRRTGDG